MVGQLRMGGAGMTDDYDDEILPGDPPEEEEGGPDVATDDVEGS